jgi:hypothetical protein
MGDDLRSVMTRLSACAHLVALDLDTLEALAYEHAVSDAVKVSGGDVVDLHAVGDQRARTALAGIERHVAPLVEHLDNALNLLHAGSSEPPPRTRRQVTKGELRDAHNARDRRRDRGEYAPSPQPRID